MDVTKKNGVPTTLEYWNGSSSTVFLSNGNSSWVGIDFQWLIPLESIHSKLKWVFSFHAYFFGCTFFILAFYTFSSILNIRSQISRKRFMSGINTFLCIFGLSRAASLFIDPYGSLKVLPVPITNAIWAIGFPSLTSSFCLLQLAFLHLTKLKYGLKLLRIEIFLRTVITLHIFSSVLRAVISSLHWSLNIVVINYICELVFLSWALFLHVSFLYIGYKVFGLLNRVPATMLQPDGCQSKGIMQLVMLAPASNLVTSVTAALMPTLLGPAANMATKAAAENTANKSTTIKQGASGLGGSEKKESDDVSPSSSSSKLNQLNKKKIKSIDEIKIDEKNKSSPQEGPKLKKLTWQSSITNGNKTESSITGPRMSNAAKRPILKESNKKDNPKIEITPEIVPACAKEKEPPVVLNVDNNDKVNKDKENDILLHTILNHIAYVNRASGGSDSGFAHCTHDATPTSRKKQVRFVLKITYATAILGFCLTLGEFFQKFGPYGLMKYYISNDDEIEPWPWFIFQTVCRSFEILMSGAIANITKQPAANVHRYYKYNPAIMKQRGSMFM